MGEAAFTPGPWHYTDDGGEGDPSFHIGFTLPEGRYRDTPEGRQFSPATCVFARLFAKMRGSHGDTRWQKGELEANARLIAAAPDLYEALNVVFHAKIIYVGGGPEESIAECGIGGELEIVRQIVSAALAKARGE